MRSLEECKAEIFRRSEEKIKKRKKQQRIIASVITPAIALTLTVSCFVLFTPEKSAEDTAFTQLNGIGGAATQAATLAPSAQQESTAAAINQDSASDYKDPQQSASLESLIEEIFAKDGTSGSVIFPPHYQENERMESSAEEYMDTQGNDLISDTSEPFTVGFSLSYPDRNECYTLTEDVLRNDSTGETAVLTQTQLNELLSLLGY